MEFRIGQGYDIHRMETGNPLVLGGVLIDAERGPAAHSDGDALLHAITDALLGAICQGDIGDLFPDTDAKNANRDSADFVREALWYVAKAGLEVNNIDATVVLEEPKLWPYKEGMRLGIARVCQCAPTQVSVKAKTNEKLDAIGFGDAVAAHAVVLLRSAADGHA
ncbi:MAG: 2-C-methyl-D-erythritol 2,4-cyclodiphosphate synthase [Planctomycetota bacterium]